MDSNRHKQAFLSQVSDFSAFQQLLDLMPDTAFFIKDRESRFILNNLKAVECCNVESEEETIGKKGFEFFSEELMAIYLEQDEEVMRTGEPIINAICPSPIKGSQAPIVYSKVALRNKEGEVIGLAGIWREIHNMKAEYPSLESISQILDIMKENYYQPLSIEKMAKDAGISKSKLRRTFQRLFRTSPTEHLQRIRVNAACRLLSESDLPITEIAQKTGFYDHSHFSRTFRRLMGIRPLTYRQRHYR